MPDPAKSLGDIDDVLSSIRRLVAQDPRASAARPEAPPSAAARGADDKLVLTPALRVTEPPTNAHRSEPAPVGATPDAGSVADVGAPSGYPEPDRETTSAAAPTASETAGRAGPPAGFEAQAPGAADDAPRTEPELEGTFRHSADMAGPADDAAAAPEPDMPVADLPIDENWTPTHADLDADGDADGDVNRVEADAPDHAAAAVDAPDDTGTAADGRVMYLDPSRKPAVDSAPDAPSARATMDLTVGDSDSGTGDSGAGDSGAGAHVGASGWRPEMRLFDWDASARPARDQADGTSGAMAEFEPDTGDADWPDTTADRVLLDLAAARHATTGDAAVGNGSATDPSDDAGETPDTLETTDPADRSDAGMGALAVFTPVFSRRSGGLTTVKEDTADAAHPATRDHRAEDVATGSDLGVDDMAVAPLAAADSALGPDVAHPPREPVDAGADEPDAPPHSDARLLAEDPPAIVAELDGPAPQTVETAILASAATAAADRALGAGASEAVADAVADRVLSETPQAAALGMDEAALRRIVAEVVRDELQGALGERITRNVRKLVRREIRLMLAADDLD